MGIVVNIEPNNIFSADFADLMPILPAEKQVDYTNPIGQYVFWSFQL